MCGITGVFAFNLVGKFSRINTAAATRFLARRGPDFQDIYTDEFVCLGHRRLSVIDTREVAHQPMWDASNRYCIVFNGEIFNYRELRNELSREGCTFRTESDTEVLLQLYIREQEKCLSRLNGFFAFCVYDKIRQSFFLARDRFGIKPLLYLFDQDKFLFGSEMKAIMAYGLEKKIDTESLLTYLQLNYIPAPYTIFENVRKLKPGHYLQVRPGELKEEPYYSIPGPTGTAPDYATAMTTFRRLMEEAVQRRLVSDVPLGSFLSGGIDSSVVAALAVKHKPDLQTFSVGFSDNAFFDETPYAEAVAKHIGSRHTTFMLSASDMYSHLEDILDYTDEPFADSSAIAVYALSRETRKHATVALSGDGADEMLGGYNKHAAAWRALHPGWKEVMASQGNLIWKMLPASRHAPFGNTVRQLKRFAEGFRMSSHDRYWHWASFATRQQALKLLSPEWTTSLQANRREEWLTSLSRTESMREIFLTDMKLVLPNDMLMKVDLMSMAHGLEVRVPFLDYQVVNFIFSLPDEYKIDGTMRKKILQDSFRDMLPPQLYKRPKKGFEVPLLSWLRKEMRTMIREDLLSEKFIREQGIFDYREIRKIRRSLFSISPGDVHARVWALVVFQWWWKKWVSAKN